MATQSWQEQRDKLMASDPNLSLIDATRQARTQQTGIVNAPVAGQAPAITPMAEAPAPVAPTTPVNVNAQQRQENIAKRQEVQPTAPVSTPTPSGATLDANGNVTPVAPTPTVPTPTTPDKTAEIKAQNQAKLEQNKQQADLRQAERDKQAMDQNQALVNNEGAILSTLISGGSVPPAKTTAYRNAQYMYGEYNKFNAMTPTQLLDNLKLGQIGSEMDRLLSQNPNYVKAKQDLDNYQKVSKLNSGMELIMGRREAEVDPMQALSDKILSNLGIQDETYANAYADYVSNNPKIVGYTEQLSSLNKQISDQTKLLNDGIKSMKEQYGSMPASALLTLIGSRFSDATTALETLNSSKTLLQADLDMAMKMADGQFKAVSQDIAQANQTKNTVIGQLIQSQFSLATKKAEAEMAQEVAREAMNDPYVAIPQMIAQYSELGIPFTRSVQQIIQDFEGSGQDLATYLTGLQKLIQEKPEYQAMQARKAGEGVSYQTFGDKVYRMNPDGTLTETNINPKSAQVATQDWSKLDDTTLFNQRTGEIKKVSPQEANAYGPSSVDVSPESVKAISSRLSGDNVQCGMVSNDWMAQKFPGAKRMGDSYESKVASVESIGVSDVPQVGGVFAMNTYNSNGHTGIVQSVDLANGTFTATDANKSGSTKGGPVTTSTYKISDNFTFSKGPAGTQNTGSLAKLGQYMIDNQDRGTGYSNDDVKAFNEKINRLVKAGDEKGMAIAYRNMIMKDKDFKKEFDDTTVFVKALDDVQSMINEYEQAGKSTNALKGMAEKVSRKLGITQDEALAKLQTQLGVTMANYIRSISGTAASDVEVQRLMGNMAQIGNVKDLNTAIVEQVRSNGIGGIKQMIDNRMYGMPEELKPQVFGDIYTQNQSTSSSTPQQTDPDFDALYNSI